MEANNINALSTATIAFVTIIGLMFGFYYNLKISNTNFWRIIFLELLFIIALGLFIIWMKWRIDIK